MNLWRVGDRRGLGAPPGRAVPVTTPSRMSGSISLSRDGRHLMYVSSDERSTIARFGLDPVTGRVREPPRPVFQGSRVIYTQDLSPSGEWVVFSTLGVREDLFLVRADGSGYRQVTDDAYRDRGPRWLPDGSRIGFYSDRSGRYETWTIHPDGSKAEVQTKTTGASRWDTVWSPDGKRLATTDGLQTWIEDLTQPLAERKAEPLPPLREIKRALLPRSWSPDGSMLAGDLDFYVSPNSVTLLYSFATREYRALPEGRGTPAWLGDSRRLLVAQHDRIVLVDTRTGRSSPVLAVPAQGLSLSRDDRWVTYIEPHSEADVWMATIAP